MADWTKILSRGNVEDRRGMSGMIGGAGGLGLIGVVAYLAIAVLGGNPTVVNDVLNQLQTSTTYQSQLQPEAFAGADNYEVFTATVLGSNNDLWKKTFTDNSRQYTEPKLVLFRQATSSACGGAASNVGPHYCPADQTIYIDETFFDVLQQQYGASGGDVAEAYVIAHEVGHHVQHQLGLDMSSVNNQQSIQVELQADCLAGMWANSVNHLGIFEPGEIQEALNAAASVGDDRVQQVSQGRVTPESWTHGSSAQRMQAFNAGYTTGSPAACDL